MDHHSTGVVDKIMTGGFEYENRGGINADVGVNDTWKTILYS